ncbi:MAG: hypothetical protein ACREIV_12255, partial [Planctomycetaceae bacterium]
MSAKVPTAARIVLPWLGPPLLACCLVSSAWGEDAVAPGFVAAPPPDVPAGPYDGSPAESLLDLDIDQLGEVDVVVPSFDVEVTSVTKTESTVG